MSETFYEVLSVPPDATTEAVEAAFREAVKETHPDVSDDPGAEDRFKQVQRAREVLTDTDERARYDRLGHDEYVAREYGGGDTATDAGATADAADATATAASADPTGPSGGDPASSGTASDTEGAAGTASDPGGATGTGADGSATPGAARASTSGGSATTASGGRSTGDGAGPVGGVGWNQSRTATQSGYATRQPGQVGLFDRPQVPLTPTALGLVAVTVVCYPLFLWASVFPPFPLAVNAVVAVCTLGMVAYLMSVPDVAIVVFGLWSILVPAALLTVEELTLFSVGGALALVAVWFPLGLAVLTRAALQR